eukprot:5052160-Prymnesium_polylepis.1
MHSHYHLAFSCGSCELSGPGRRPAYMYSTPGTPRPKSTVPPRGDTWAQRKKGWALAPHVPNRPAKPAARRPAPAPPTAEASIIPAASSYPQLASMAHGGGIHDPESPQSRPPKPTNQQHPLRSKRVAAHSNTLSSSSIHRHAWPCLHQQLSSLGARPQLRTLSDARPRRRGRRHFVSH